MTDLNIYVNKMNEALLDRLGIIDGVRIIMTHDAYMLSDEFEIYPKLSKRTKSLLTLGTFGDYVKKTDITIHINNCDGAPLRKTNIQNYSLEEAIQEITKNKKILTMMLKQNNKDSL